jgi:(2Fe-2S) ferredoxin
MAKCEKLKTIEKQYGTDKPCLAICAGKHCAKAGTKHILRAARAALDEAGLDSSVDVVLTKCQDYCDDAPVVSVLPGEFPYTELAPANMSDIVAEHLRGGKPVLTLLDKRARKRLKKA